MSRYIAATILLVLGVACAYISYRLCKRYPDNWWQTRFLKRAIALLPLLIGGQLLAAAIYGFMNPID